MTDHIYVNGKIYFSSRAKISVNDRGFLYGDGVFETMRSYGGKIFMLFSHLERLFSSLRALKFSPGFDRDSVIDALDKTLIKSGLAKKDAYIRIMVTRGQHKGSLHFDTGSKCSLVIITKKLEPYPEKYYSHGVEIISSSLKRQPLGDQVYKHKLMNYFESLYEKDRAHSRGVFESVFLTKDALVLEGSTTNIFITGDSTVYTPPLSQNILGGITRQVILQLCRANGFRTREKSIHYRDLKSASEVFLTNSVAGVLPVRKVDAYVIGTRIPGRITSRLMGLYNDAVKNTEMN